MFWTTSGRSGCASTSSAAPLWSTARLTRTPSPSFPSTCSTLTGTACSPARTCRGQSSLCTAPTRARARQRPSCWTTPRPWRIGTLEGTPPSFPGASASRWIAARSTCLCARSPRSASRSSRCSTACGSAAVGRPFGAPSRGSARPAPSTRCAPCPGAAPPTSSATGGTWSPKSARPPATRRPASRALALSPPRRRQAARGAPRVGATARTGSQAGGQPGALPAPPARSGAVQALARKQRLRRARAPSRCCDGRGRAR
mmetsp:Transcript_24641/g.93142  ORF Transcript_24641/g.93142 Transcript_24641/m.93142 type:complete len:258 (-) Transcript_24641:1072-1845(-)